MPKIDLLFNYSTLEGMDHAVNSVSKRIRFENNLYGSVEELAKNFATLEADFYPFFQELQVAVKHYKERNRTT
jgi:acyl carrier protein phosphodiesterase